MARAGGPRLAAEGRANVSGITARAGRLERCDRKAKFIDKDGAGLVRGEGVPFSPLAQGHDDGEQVEPGRGERVELPPARGGSMPVKDPSLDQAAETVGKDVARDAGALLEVGE